MSVKYNFEGRSVIVTGGGKGLGKAIVKQLVKSRCTLIHVIDKDQQALEQLQKEFPLVKVSQVDVLNWDETAKTVEAIGPVNYLINNAGIPEPDDFLQITSAGIDRIFGVNFKALVNVSQVVAQQMIKQGNGGSIVNVSSVLDDKALKGMGMYCCTKAAVTMLTKSMALELGPHNIRVNCVRPSVMITSLISDPAKQQVAEHVFQTLTDHQVNKKVLTVEETVDAILFLCSDASYMVNGSDILIDGGIYTH